MNLRPQRKAPEARLLLNLLQGLFIIIIITKEAEPACLSYINKICT